MAAIDVMAQPALSTGSGELLPRVASAAVLAPLALAAAYVGTPVFEGALAAVAGVLAWEWTAMCQSRRPVPVRALLTLAAVGAILAVMAGAPLYATVVIAVGAAAASVVEGGERRAWMAAGAVYIGLPLAACEWLRVSSGHGREIVIWLLIVVWAADTVAYLFGRTFGGPKLAPAISPKKTWAGLAGAAVGAALAGAIVAVALGARDALGLAGMAAIFGLAGQGGDLLESAVKRRFGVKDASQLIPGHGGLFDRLDAFMAVVVFAALARLAGWQGGESW
ncbi:MAG: phosphatidate cytidylyltransferase [Rhodospirillales bacterium]|nr:phosphatidate cytidylyltransferase [Rhodospirillales bacterium]